MTSATGECRKGFTLIEFLLVIIITAVLITVSLPHFRNSFDDFRLNNFSGELQLFMTYLKDRSIVEGKVVVLTIDNENQKLWAQFKDDESPLRNLSLPQGLFLNSTQKQVFFYPDGQIDNVTLEVMNAGGKRVILTTKGVFGGLKILTED
ncbi:MAG: prepilin-type N-terminal cleavage/methylation domain-containing protein [Candidatus Omnitrophota bacterium]